MAEEDYQQQPDGQLGNGTLEGIPFVPRQFYNQGSSILNEHLKVDSMLEYIEKVLFGYQLDENEEWVKVQILIGYTEEKKPVFQDSPPLMEANKIRMIMSYLKTMLHSNTFLTDIPDDNIINDMMFETSQMLVPIFFKTRNKISIELMLTMWNSIINSIHLGLLRGSHGRTLNAIAKMQQSHEIIQKNDMEQKKEFKLFG